MPIVPDDVMFAKAAVVERSLRRVLDIYRKDSKLDDLLYLDALTLNAQRACQAAIDLVMHVVAIEHLGVPQSQADAFRILAENDYLSPALADSMVGMCGFRNVLVHQYQELELSILHQIADKGWQDLVELCRVFGLKIDVR